MLVVFSPIFLADTKIIFQYDFVAPLTNKIMLCYLKFYLGNNSVELLEQDFIENSIYIRSLCVQTNIYEKNLNSIPHFMDRIHMFQGFLPLLGCRLLSLLL